MAFVPPLLAAAASSIGTFAGSATGVASIASAGLSAITAIEAGNYQAAVAKNNAMQAVMDANAESEAGQVNAMRSDIDYAAALAGQMAEQGASGFDMLSRSQMATRNRTRKTREEAALDIRNDSTNAARRLMQDAANYRAEGKMAKTQGYLSAFSDVLSLGQSFATSRSGGRRPWDNNRNWYKN